jgi:hypothetical protein
MVVAVAGLVDIVVRAEEGMSDEAVAVAVVGVGENSDSTAL